MKHGHAWMLCVGLLGLAGCGAPSGEAPEANAGAGDLQVSEAPLYGAYISDCHFTSSGSGLACTGAVYAGTAPYTYWWKKDSGAWTSGTLSKSFTCTGGCSIYFAAQDATGAWYEDSPVHCDAFFRTCSWEW